MTTEAPRRYYFDAFALTYTSKGWALLHKAEGMVGTNAADVIQQVALAIKTECTVEEIVETIHTHPTFSEALAEAGDAWMGQGLHSV